MFGILYVNIRLYIPNFCLTLVSYTVTCSTYFILWEVATWRHVAAIFLPLSSNISLSNIYSGDVSQRICTFFQTVIWRLKKAYCESHGRRKILCEKLSGQLEEFTSKMENVIIKEMEERNFEDLWKIYKDRLKNALEVCGEMWKGPTLRARLRGLWRRKLESVLERGQKLQKWFWEWKWNFEGQGLQKTHRCWGQESNVEGIFLECKEWTWRKCVYVNMIYYRNERRSGTTINVDISVTEVVKDMKNGKAEGLDEMTASMVKYREK